MKNVGSNLYRERALNQLLGQTYFVRSETLDRGPPVKSVLPRNVSELEPSPSLPPLPPSTESHSKLAKLWSPRARFKLVLVIGDQDFICLTNSV